MERMLRAEQLRPQRRTGAPGGRPYIGPKVQFCMPEEDYNFVIEMVEERGAESYPEVLREVMSAGVAALRGVA